MFYFGILSSYIPYLLFFVASVFYLGFNYVQNTKPEAQVVKTITATEDTEHAFAESSTISFSDISAEQFQLVDNDHQRFTYTDKNRAHKNILPCLKIYFYSPYNFHFSRPPPTMA